MSPEVVGEFTCWYVFRELSTGMWMADPHGKTWTGSFQKAHKYFHIDSPFKVFKVLRDPEFPQDWSADPVLPLPGHVTYDEIYAEAQKVYRVKRFRRSVDLRSRYCLPQ